MDSYPVFAIGDSFIIQKLWCWYLSWHNCGGFFQWQISCPNKKKGTHFIWGFFGAATWLCAYPFSKITKGIAKTVFFLAFNNRAMKGICYVLFQHPNVLRWFSIVHINIQGRSFQSQCILLMNYSINMSICVTFQLGHWKKPHILGTFLFFPFFSKKILCLGVTADDILFWLVYIRSTYILMRWDYDIIILQ